MEDYLFEKVVMHPNVSVLPVSEMTETIRTFREVLNQIAEEAPNATVKQLLEPAAK